MRLLAFFLPLVALAAKGQETWTYLQTSIEDNVFVMDLAMDEDGSTLCYYTLDSIFTVKGNGGLVRISSTGVAGFNRTLGGVASTFLPTAIVSGTDERLHILGSYKRPLDSTAGFAHYGCLPDGTVMDSVFYKIPGFNRTALENAALTNEGNILMPGSGALPGLPFYTYSAILLIGQNGDSLNYLEYGSGNAFAWRITRGVVDVPNGMLISIENPYSNEVYYRILDENLYFQNGWTGHEPHPDPDPWIGPDSLLGGALTLLPLNNGEYLVGGQIEDVDYDRRSAVFKINETGAVLKMFTPSTPYLHDYSALLSTLAVIDDSTFYFLSWKNIALTPTFAPYNPTEPDQIVVYELDNDLNVLCEYILNGFADNAYYVPNRIKTAPDGGFVLLGGRKDMSIPNSKFVGWAQKFAPGDCTTSIHGTNPVDQLQAFPNPGRASFTVILNGGAMEGSLELYDVTGKLQSTTAMYQSRATVDAQQLAVGLYLYRILDVKGQLRGTGKWQKE